MCVCLAVLERGFRSSPPPRVPSSQALPSCLAHARCCCPCWWPCLSQSTRGLAWDPVPIRSTAMGRRVTPTVHKAAGPRARSPCWRTAAYNLSWRGQKLFMERTAHMERGTGFNTRRLSDLRHTSDWSASMRPLCVQTKSGHTFLSSLLFLKTGSWLWRAWIRGAQLCFWAAIKRCAR